MAGDIFTFFTIYHAAVVNDGDTRKPKNFKTNVPVPLCLPQILRGLVWN